MELFIRNMVCSRCITAVQNAFENAGLVPLYVRLGEVVLKEKPTKEKLENLQESLNKLGFEIIDNRKSKLIEQVKNIIVQMIHHDNDIPDINLSVHLSQKLHVEYNYLSNIFSEVEGITIEKYLIAQKIEKIKELLMYDEHSLAEIADRLGYSSAAYLSGQFKKETGLAPSFYKGLKENRRRNIEDL